MPKMVNIIESAFPIILAIIPIAIALNIYNTSVEVWRIFTCIQIMLLLYYAVVLAIYRQRVQNLYKEITQMDEKITMINQSVVNDLKNYMIVKKDKGDE